MFSRAREKARSTACLSNVKQVGLAFTMYSADYDESIVGTWCGYPQTIWAHLLYPYIKNEQIFNCPSDKYAIQWTNGINPDTGAADRRMAFGYNTSYGWDRVPEHQGPGRAWSYGLRKIAGIRAPAECIWMADSRFYHPSTYGYTIRDTVQIHNSGAWPNPRHNEGCNVSFMDGHAKWLSFSYLRSADANHHWYVDNKPHLP
ncbi:MAG: DUF1559 domain-containing protein [Armatimonadota bacterium]|nr:DUF1559 domain-containing protein [Armatimonadota bacterium]